jgi:hypothetical protein
MIVLVVSIVLYIAIGEVGKHIIVWGPTEKLGNSISYI